MVCDGCVTMSTCWSIYLQAIHSLLSVYILLLNILDAHSSIGDHFDWVWEGLAYAASTINLHLHAKLSNVRNLNSPCLAGLFNAYTFFIQKRECSLLHKVMLFSWGSEMLSLGFQTWSLYIEQNQSSKSHSCLNSTLLNFLLQ